MAELETDDIMTPLDNQRVSRTQSGRRSRQTRWSCTTKNLRRWLRSSETDCDCREPLDREHQDTQVEDLQD